jgi:CcmD family protein
MTLKSHFGSRINRPLARALALGGLLSISLLAGVGQADKAPPPPRRPDPAVEALLAPSPSPAANPSAQAGAADKDGFVPESRPPAMSNVEAGLPAAPLVGAAYGFIWLAVFGFVVWTLRRTTQLEAEIADLRQRIGSQGGSK